MMVAFGEPDIRVADHAHYGTVAPLAYAVTAMEGRAGYLMANHGMLTAEPNLARAAWLAHELEALANQYYHSLLIGGHHLLTDAELAEVATGFTSYGVQRHS